MGLDMSLYGELFLFDMSSEQIKIRHAMPEIDLSPKYVVFKAIYWRKANQIHRWFVENVQDGTDDCGTYNVTTEQLGALLQIARIALDTRDPSILPTQEGFFFGNTDYDEDYWKDIDYTVKSLEKILNDNTLRDLEFKYHSSW